MVEQDAAEFDWHAAEAALMWQIDLGVEDWLLDAPLNRYDLPEAAKLALPQVAAAPVPQLQVRPAPMPSPPEAPKVDPVALAREHAAKAEDLAGLRAALAGFDGCELRRGARNLVFGLGQPGARVMVLSDAPSADEDREGRLFVGATGALFAQMFDAIGLGCDAPDVAHALYASPIMPWRPPGERALDADEIALMMPFVARHIALAAPEIIVVMGAAALLALTGERSLVRMRGQWREALGRPVLPMLHPGFLMRNPVAKRDAWMDLLQLQARLRG